MVKNISEAYRNTKHCWCFLDKDLLTNDFHTLRQKATLVFRLDALAKALSVIATATWLAGWLSHSGIVSKPLNLSENFFDHLKAPSF